MEQGKPGHQKQPAQPQHQAGGTKQPESGRRHGDDDAVGKDTDNDGRVVKPGHKAGDVDGSGSKSVGKDTDNDGRAVKPGHKPGEVDGQRSR